MKPVTFDDYRERMLRVLVFIQQNLDRELSLEELAGLAQFSPYHFHRIFRGMVGESLGTHIRRIRLERAAFRLRSSDDGVTRIALEAGYQSHAAFTRAFRTMTGTSPSAFRARHRLPRFENTPSGVRYESSGGVPAFTPRDSGGRAMEVSIQHVGPWRVAFTRHIGPYDKCGPVWEEFLTHMGAAGYLGAGSMFIGLCHDDPDITPRDKTRYDCCVTVDEGFEPIGPIGVQTIPEGDFAVTTHHGPYDALGDTYGQLCGEWLPRSGRVIRSAPCLEVYLNSPESTEPKELLTDIYMPLEPR